MRVVSRWIVVMTLLVSTWPALAQVRVSITVGPPPLPVYVQPICPGDGYIWMPGYWGWDELTVGYYWIPGTWILPPRVGFLWTPGYWVWQDTSFVFVRGYWGPVVGFYGGINYGFGYPGHGYYGGRWTDGHFFYNRDVTNVNVTVVHNTYVENVVVDRSPTRVSFNGGKDGIVARPTAAETAAVKQSHVPETEQQTEHALHARSIPELHATQNNGKPPVLAMTRPAAPRAQDARPRGSESARLPPSNAREPERSRDAERAHPLPAPQPRLERPGGPSGAGVEDGRPSEHARPETHARPEEHRDTPTAPQPSDRTQTRQQSGNEHASKPHQADNKGQHGKDSNEN